MKCIAPNTEAVRKGVYVSQKASSAWSSVKGETGFAQSGPQVESSAFESISQRNTKGNPRIVKNESRLN